MIATQNTINQANLNKSKVNPNVNDRIKTLAAALGYGSLAVAVLDAADGVAYYYLTQKLNPIQVLQYIASGAMGAAAFSGGLGSAFAGLLIHLGISAAFTGFFVMAYLQFEAVRRYAVPVGLGYGALVWLFMNLIVLPHSAVAPSPITALAAVHGMIGHALFVGLPAALAARKWLGDRA